MSWADANQRHLVAALAVVGDHVDRYGDGAPPGDESTGFQAELAAAAEPLEGTAAIDRLVATFGLSDFERDVVLLVAGIELDSTFPARCAAAAGGVHLTQPTFGLALASLPGAHWSALAPSGPLRHWKLVEVGPGDALTTARLRIDERILHFLTGIDFVDERLASYVEAVPVDDQLPPSHQTIANRILDMWTRNVVRNPTVSLTGPDTRARTSIAAAAAAQAGLDLQRLVDDDIPVSASERDAMVRLWERDAALSGRVLLIDHGGGEAGERAAKIANTIGGPIVLSGRDGIELRDRTTVGLEVGRPTADEQRSIWVDHLGAEDGVSDEAVTAVVRQFDLGTEQIRAATLDLISRRDDAPATALWRAARRQSRPEGQSLATRIDAKSTWDDLVLPATQLATLRQIGAQVRHRNLVYDDWGFAARESRGLGISALFSGRTGTGKTMAAEVLANELELDLFRIDLSSVVSKYIGETEKNLRRVFDGAETGGAILLFDEADALFGRRSEVRDSHDRYANIEVSYLLQRMESYRGLAILTTNMRDALDPAFLRRIRFTIDFPFPDRCRREQIWRRAFPDAAPIGGVEPDLLARLDLAGGNIRNIALNAAFIAAGEGTEVGMAQLAEAARHELAKLDRRISEADLEGWT